MKRKQLSTSGGLLRLRKSQGSSSQITDPRFNAEKVIEPEYSFDELIDIYETNNTARKCIELYAKNVVAGGWDIVPDGTEGKETERDKLLAFFESPNPESTFSEIIKEMVIDLKGAGSAGLEVGRGIDKLPKRLYTIPISTLRVAKGEAGVFRTGQRFVQNEEKTWESAVWYNRYYSNPEDRTEENGYNPDLNGEGVGTNEVMFFTEPNPKSRYYGQSSSITLLRNYLLTKYAEEFNINEFENGLLSKVIISIVDGKLSDESLAALNEFMDDLLENGAWSSIPILTVTSNGNSANAGLKVDRISADVKEGSYIELMKYNREEVYVAYGVPPVLLGITENSTLANQEAQERKFFEKEIMPLQEEIAYRFTRMIKEDFGFMNWKFEFATPDFRNKVQEAEMGSNGLKDGSLSINEKRELMGYKPLENENGERLEGAEKHIVYTQYGPIPVEDLDKLTTEDALAQIGAASGKMIVENLLNLRNKVEKQAEKEKIMAGTDSPEDANDGDYPIV